MPHSAPPSDRLHPTVRAYVQNPAIAETYDQHFACNNLFQYDCGFLDEHLAPPGRILDVGCGTGRHLVHLAHQGFTAVGLDLSPHMLAQARANLAANSCRAQLVQGDLLSPPLRPGARFDGILLMFSTLGMIHRARERQAALRALRPLLAHRGRLLLHVHNYYYRAGCGAVERVCQSLREWAGLDERGDTVMPSYRGIQDLYLHSFTADEIRDLVEASGYQVLELRPLNAERTGPYRGPAAGRNANGFLVAAS